MTTNAEPHPDYVAARELRTELLAAVSASVRLKDDDGPDPTIGRVIAMQDSLDDDLYRQIYNQAGDDVEVMVWVAWSRTNARPEYVEDLVRTIAATRRTADGRRKQQRTSDLDEARRDGPSHRGGLCGAPRCRQALATHPHHRGGAAGGP